MITYNESLTMEEVSMLFSLLEKTIEEIKHQEFYLRNESMEFVSLKIAGQWYRLETRASGCDFNGLDDLFFLRFRRCEEEETEYPPECNTANTSDSINEKLVDVLLIEDAIERKYNGVPDSVLNHTKAIIFVLESKQYCFELDSQYCEFIRVNKGQSCVERVKSATIYWGNGEPEDGYSWHCTRKVVSVSPK